MLVCNYEVIRTNDLAMALLDILMNVEPAQIKRQIGFNFGEVMKAEGVDAAKAFFKSTKADSLLSKNYIWAEDDGALAYPGYLYMEQAMYPQAIEILKFNLEQFPTSAWANCHLAIGYARSEENALARQHFEKAIALLPEEEYFKEEMAKLGME